MLKPLIRTLNGWRFELPLALVLGAATAFAMIAMPESLFGRVPGVVGSGQAEAIQIAAAVLLALIAGFAAYRAMKHRWGAVPSETIAEEAVEEELALPPIDVAMRLRRADAHPDFPPRAPIRASRDLGEPFMDIMGFADGPNAADIVTAKTALIADAVYVELSAAPPILVAAADVPTAAEDATADAAVDDKAVGDDVIEHEPVEDGTSEEQTVADSEDHLSIVAFEPEIVPAPRPERARRESLAEMMERLSAGLERRAGNPVPPPPADRLAEVLARPRAATPELRDALDELNRLAGRRG